MALFKIYPKDYTDLNEKISEKNIINTVYGKEHIVTSIEGTQLNTTSINPETTSKIFDSVPYTNDTAKYNKDLIVYSNMATAGVFSLEADRDWARTETLYLTGSYEFITEEVIADESSISCSFNINYIRSSTDNLNDSLYNVRNKTSFFGFGGGFPLLENDNDYNLSTNKFLESKQGTAIAQFLWAKAEAVAPMPSLKEYCEAKIINKTSAFTTIKVSYRFKIWAGWTTDNQQENTVLCVNNITINTVANTVDTTDSPFSYQEELIDIERKYELETNELFQVGSEDLTQDRLSYKTYQKIVDAYDTDRRIITFDLLNPIKQTINDSEKFEAGREESRYLDTDDEFDIYDEHNVFMGTFKVLQGNPIWDGSYHKRITAILVD